MKFCTSCQSHKPEEGGEMRAGRRFRRWMCKGCAEHKTESIYKSNGGPAWDIARLMGQLRRKI